MNSGDVILQKHGGSSSNAMEASCSKTRTATRPENRDNSMSQNSLVSSNNSAEKGTCPSGDAIVIQPVIAAQLANQGGGTDHSSYRTEQELPKNADVMRSNSPVNVGREKVVKSDPSGLIQMSLGKTPKDENDEKDSCVIEVECGDGEEDNDVLEKVCRICHLDSDYRDPEAAASKTDMIQLGCSCKGELGFAHPHCAAAWFRLKGNRMCEICGDTARNVSAISGNEFIEQWNETRVVGEEANSSERRVGCWQGQPFCNFLIACLVIGFVLPWFLRIDML